MMRILAKAPDAKSFICQLKAIAEDGRRQWLSEQNFTQTTHNETFSCLIKFEVINYKRRSKSNESCSRACLDREPHLVTLILKRFLRETL